ncbi:uncharacterized protein LOC131957295 [Physella acuta]|uniref:uncharacterized protein LOC131957295 n=1 Tax=Physella acuta TaxID=109671 RepID=UPI0027DB6463|nr:uncharacterized protein LOC131957295 [Physella acuta]
MDKVLAILTLVFFVVCLPDTIVCQKGFNATIEGYERDCVNYSCRYTGRVVARFYDPNTNPDPPRMVYIRYCPLGSWFACSEVSRLPLFYCFVFMYPCPNRDCIKDKYPCYTDYGNPALIKFYPNPMYNALYHLLVAEKKKGPMEFRILHSGNNIFNSTKPADWNPVVNFTLEDYQNILFESSTNGNGKKKSDFFVAVFGVLPAYYLVYQLLAK